MTDPFNQAKAAATKVLTPAEADARVFWVKTRTLIIVGTSCLTVGFIIAKLF